MIKERIIFNPPLNKENKGNVKIQDKNKKDVLLERN
jgi:hypothetical protein